MHLAAIPLIVGFLIPFSARAEEKILIESAGVSPSILRTTAEQQVTFVNRTGRMVHVEFIGDSGRHHVYQVPGQIWAIFHRPGHHPYVVHFPDGTLADLQGVVEVLADPRGRPDPQACVGVTVMGVCLEQ